MGANPFKILGYWAKHDGDAGAEAFLQQHPNWREAWEYIRENGDDRQSEQSKLTRDAWDTVFKDERFKKWQLFVYEHEGKDAEDLPSMGSSEDGFVFTFSEVLGVVQKYGMEANPKLMEKEEKYLIEAAKPQYEFSEEEIDGFVDFFLRNPRLAVGEAGGKCVSKKKPTVTFVIGMGASGKSTLIRNTVASEEGKLDFVVIDADEYRNAAPEYALGAAKAGERTDGSGGELARYGYTTTSSGKIEADGETHVWERVGRTQKLQKAVRRGVTEDTIRHRYDAFYPTIGDTLEGLEEKAEPFEKAGYEVHVILNRVPIDEQMARTENRDRYIGVENTICGAASIQTYIEGKKKHLNWHFQEHNGAKEKK